ncbi:KICSTOR complex protein C12orf66-like [Homarus americanus]|uniref:KICSTOR complex protein C12orf66-like n=1 Tax=Homarus americanus TaxID=6706 RepID=A0A8J5K984_HOMAM|nr:KICSTOR complex protein C12orf66-like [Homarus americanus]
MASSTKHSSDHEEVILQGLLAHFSNFNYDKAKEHAEKERDTSRFSGSTVWQSLLTCVTQLAATEKLYMNLSFLTAKGFLRKESSVRASYELLNVELGELGTEKKKTVSNNGNASTGGPTSSGSPGCDGILRHLCSHLVLFIKARLQMIVFYERLIEMSVCRLMNFEELLSHLIDVSAKNSRNFHHPLLTPIKTGFTYECDILIHLLRSQIEMQCWRFLPSLLHLHDAHSKLNSWHTLVQSKETKKYGFGSSFLKSSPLPALYQWFWQAKAAFVSKFSLYFHETLAAQSSPADMKALISRQGQACDYVSKSDAASVCLVFEAAGVEDYQGAGYHHPEESMPPPKGLDSYPAIFTYPPTKPMDRWPSIVMRVSDRSNEHDLLDRVVHFYDQQVGSTYFLCRVEPRITFVAVFDAKKSEKDNYIRDFVYDLVMQLRCNKVFANLKPK